MQMLKAYAVMFVAIDGALQAECQKIDVRNNGRKARAYMRSAVPAAGIELDVRGHVGGDRRFVVKVLAGADVMFNRSDMRCVYFAIGQDVRGSACARYIFESVDDAEVQTFGQSVSDPREETASDPISAGALQGA